MQEASLHKKTICVRDLG